MSLLAEVHRSGFAHSADLVHLFVGGSQLHGAKVAKTDDLDIYGVFIEPPEETLGLTRLDHYVWSTAGDDRRNGPDDVDVTLYSLRKWASLAAKGNATTLHFFFAPEDPEMKSAIWKEVVSHRPMFLSKHSGDQFRGFAESQLRRLKGEGVGKHGIREEYVGKYGYDTKAAMHLLRLLFEGIELLSTGWLTLPRPEKDLLISVRSGEFGSLDKVLDFANRKFLELDEAQQKSPLPDIVDREAVSKLVSRLYLKHWAARGLI
ncbi:MAG TPA: nucleotidyltransferase domain-containing protein [Candidatus Koribacter sp.]|jgi:predicted nucleotidyltransferase